MDSGTAAFHGTSAGVQGIYSGNGGAISTLVAPSSAIPNGTGNFTSLNVNFRYDGGTVVFVGSGTAPTQSGVYTATGGVITRTADLNTAIPNGTGNYTSFSPFPSVSGSSVTYTGGGSSSQTGVYSTATGSLGVVADLNTAAPGATGNFTGFGSNPSVSGTTSVFRGSSILGTNTGIYQRTGGGAVSVVADINTPIPGGGGMNFGSPFFEPTISGSNVSFINGNAVYARIGGVLTTIANTSTPAPNGTGNFTAITAYAPISGSNVAFIGSSSGANKGIYLFSGGQLFTLVDNTSGSLDGRPLAATPFFFGPHGISGNQFAFGVAFSTGGNGIYMATFTPVPEPSALILMGTGLVLTIRRRRIRRG